MWRGVRGNGRGGVVSMVAWMAYLAACLGGVEGKRAAVAGRGEVIREWYAVRVFVVGKTGLGEACSLGDRVDWKACSLGDRVELKPMNSGGLGGCADNVPSAARISPRYISWKILRGGRARAVLNREAWRQLSCRYAPISVAKG